MLVDEYDAFLLDLDGVVYVGDQPVRGAVEAIERLRDRNVSFRFVTNNSSRTRSDIREKLVEIGVEADREEVVSAAYATRRYHRFRASVPSLPQSKPRRIGLRRSSGNRRSDCSNTLRRR